MNEEWLGDGYWMADWWSREGLKDGGWIGET